ncbi:MAG: hypothetical protein WC222_01375 [Parachlamydiales bacterium]|jgi:hypothetical protein
MPYEDPHKWSRKITKYFLIATVCPFESKKLDRKVMQELWRGAIDKMPKGQAGAILLEAHPMFNNGKYATYNLAIVTGIATLPPEDMKVIVKTLQPYLLPDKFGYENTFRALSKLKDQCLIVLKQALPFLRLRQTQETECCDSVVSRIIEETAKLLFKKTQGKKILEWTSTLAEERRDVLEIIRAIKRIGSAFRSEVIKRLGPHLKKSGLPCDSQISAADILNEVVKFPENRILQVVKRAQVQFVYYKIHNPRCSLSLMAKRDFIRDLSLT